MLHMVCSEGVNAEEKASKECIQVCRKLKVGSVLNNRTRIFNSIQSVFQSICGQTTFSKQTCPISCRRELQSTSEVLTYTAEGGKPIDKILYKLNN